jgi:polyisoprenyl-teichoic acid--peptidoglycan teichoic acid transferase
MPRTRGGVLWRGVLAAFLVIGFVAATTAVAGLLQVKQIVGDLNLSKALTSQNITPPSPGAPQTLLLIGVDHRAGEGSGPGQTDTMILVRIDDSSSTINLLSIPRDLGVEIPGVGFSKINAAYEDGGKNGANLLLQTLQQHVFPGLKVNHILVVDFQSFADLITSLGCVYSEVDHRYYNDNTGQSVANNYSSIDIQPGYQELCGDNGAPNSALAFVRFRHNDSDLVRESRQQDFLRWAKEQFTAGELYSKKDALLRDFGKDVQTDHQLHTTDGVDELFGLAFNADGSAIKSIPFPAGPGATSSAIGDYLTFSEAQSQQAYSELLTPTATPVPTATTPTKPPSTGKKKKKKKLAPIPAGLIANPTDGNSQAAQLEAPGLPVYYPRYIPDDFQYCFSITANCNEDTNPTSAYVNSYPRRYSIREGGSSYPSYVMTLVMQSGGETDLGTGQYFTVQGTTWQDPPILRDPTAIKVIDGKPLDEYSQAGLLTLVAWHTKTAVYWISNTLQNIIPNKQMVAMAATLAHAT